MGNLDNFKSLLEGGTGPANVQRNTQAVRQLLAESPECRTYLHALGWDEPRLRHLLLLPAVPVEDTAAAAGFQLDYELAFDKARRSLADFLAPGRPAACSPRVLSAELDGLSEEERSHRVATDRRFAEPELVQFLIERSLGHRYENPDRMLHWALLARIAAEACSVEGAGSAGRLSDLKARAWAHFSNALRVCGRLREAEEALTIAWQLAAQGTGDPLVKARLCEYMATLYSCQRRFEQAIERAEEAGRIYRELGETQMLAVTLVSKATSYLYGGDPETAVEILHRVLPLIDEEKDPHLLLAACHNLVRCYIDLQLPEKALSLYQDSHELYRDLEGTLIQLRATWQEGQLLRDLGCLETAEKALLKARGGFIDRGLAYEVALISLDLAAVYVKLGLVDAVRRTVIEALPTFRALQVDREAMVAFLQLQQVADQEAKALSLIRMVNACLEQLPGRYQPQR